jgi:hypothetical protein
MFSFQDNADEHLLTPNVGRGLLDFQADSQRTLLNARRVH